MKKIFTLLAVLLCTVMANAQVDDLYEWYIEGTTEVRPSMFSSGNLSPNTAYTGTYVTINGKTIKCTKGAKMGSSTYVNFNAERSCTVIIVQSISRADDEKKNPTLKFDGTEMPLNSGVENPEGCATVRVYTLTGIGAGEHSVTRGSGQTGLMYVGFYLDQLSGEQLATPEITFVPTSGEVTIAPVANATKVVYTTDGTSPTEESTEYTAPFTVDDGTVVKAMAIGDGDTYFNSTIAEVQVLLAGLTCEAPVINQFNGTFALTTTTVLATCEYTIDGTTWIEYTHPVTFFENTTVKARTVRANWTTSDVVEAEIVALPLPEGTKTVYLGGGAFELANEKKVLRGKDTDVAAGYSIEFCNADKTWTITKDKITISEGVDRTAYYGSNGAQNILHIPDGIKVYRVTFYSYMPSLGRVSGWDEVAGETFNQFNDIPLLSKDPANPDVRVFNLDGVTGSFTFKQTGERPNFVMVLEVAEVPTLSAPWQSGDKEAYEVGERVYLLHEDPEATIIYTLDGADPDENNIYTEAEPAAAPARIAAATDEDHAGKTYSLTERPIVFNGEPLNITYKAIKDGFKPSEVQTLAIDGGGQTTGIENVAVDSQNAPVEFFNLQGVRVENPSAGIFIRRQGNNVSKVIVK